MLKSYFKLLFILALFVLAAITGCKKNSENNPVNPGNPANPVNGSGSITLNGGEYNNKTINFNLGIGGYSVSDQMTVCVFYGAVNSDSLMVVVEFPQKAAGDFQWEEFTENSSNLNGVGLSVYNSSGTYKYFVPVSGGKTKVSKYGNVGENIEGNFSGTLKDAIFSSGNIDVSGSFKVLRMADE